MRTGPSVRQNHAEVRLLHSDDLDFMLSYNMTRMSFGYNSKYKPLYGAMLGNLAGQGLSHASYSRTFAGIRISGHISGHLIRNEVAKSIFDSGQVEPFLKHELAPPLSADELQENNQSGTGSTLMLTSLVWNRESDDVNEFFAMLALEHLVRWFVGNRLGGILLYYTEDAAPTIEPTIGRLPYAVVSTRLNRDGFWLKYLQRNDYFASGGGLMANWVSQLLETPHYSKVAISRSRKLHGRVLYEFDFDIPRAVTGCIPTWSMVPGMRATCPSAEAWRKEVALDLNINPNRSRGYPSMAEVARMITRDPTLLALH